MFDRLATIVQWMDGAHRLRRDRVVALVAVVCGVCAWLWGTYRYGVFGPFGSDPDIWLYSALNIGVGAPSVGPPGYPALVWLLQQASGLSVVAAGVWVSLVSFALLPAAIYVLGRTLGLSWKVALVPAFVAPMLPAIREFGHQVQPDALTTLGLTVSVILVHRAVVGGARKDWIIAVSWVGLLALLREHGMLLLCTVGALGLFAPGSLKDRALRCGLPLGIWWLGSCLFSMDWVLPWAAPWHRRVAMAVEAVGAVNLNVVQGVNLPSYVIEMTTDQVEVFRGLYARDDKVGIVWFHLAHSLSSATTLWVCLALAFVGALKLDAKARMVMLAHLVVVVPTLFIWSKDRHLEVLIPIALVSVMVAVSRSPRWVLLGFVFGLGHWTSVWPHKYGVTMERLQREAVHNARVKSFGTALCELVQPGDLVAGPEMLATLYCPLPRHTVNNDAGAADWHTWYIGRGPLGEDWHFVEVGEAIYPVRRLKPWLEGADRPCRDVLPHPNMPYHEARTISAEMDGECRAETF